LLFYVQDEELEVLIALVKNEMESIIDKKINLKVERICGKNREIAHYR